MSVEKQIFTFLGHFCPEDYQGLNMQTSITTYLKTQDDLDFPLPTRLLRSSISLSVSRTLTKSRFVIDVACSIISGECTQILEFK